MQECRKRRCRGDASTAIHLHQFNSTPRPILVRVTLVSGIRSCAASFARFPCRRATFAGVWEAIAECVHQIATDARGGAAVLLVRDSEQ